jgi:hypothetical protein
MFTAGFISNISLLATVGTVSDFSHYQPIIDRKPFGEVIPPDTKAADAAKLSLEESFAKDFELKSIIEDPDVGFQAGIMDKRNNKTFYLKIGEKYQEIELVSVDYDAEKIVVKKENETVIVKMRPLKSTDEIKKSPAAPQPLFSSEPARNTTTVPAHRKPFFQGFQPVTNNAQPKPFEAFFKPLTNANPFGSGSSPFKPIQTDGKPMPNPFEELIRRQREARAKQQQQQQQDGKTAAQPAQPFSPFNPAEGNPPQLFQPQQEQQQQPPPLPAASEGTEQQSPAQGFFQPLQPATYEDEY